MDKKIYETPCFQFHELFLFEGVADPCWAHKHADVTIFYDANHNDILDAQNGEPVIYQRDFDTSGSDQHGDGCANVTNNINKAIDSGEIRASFSGEYARYWDEKYITTILEHENAGESASVYIPIHS